MGRTLEAIFRRPMRLLLLIIALPVACVAIAYSMVPRTYQTTASLWALRPYESVSASGTGTDQFVTAADSQATALSELLSTRTFALAVAKSTQLASALNLDASTKADPQLVDDVLFNEISHNVLVVPQGDNLFTISYINRNPHVAQQVVQSVVQNYAAQSEEFTASEAQQLLQTYQTQLAKAKQAAGAAAAAEAQYLVEHPDLKRQTVINDPQYALLHAQTQQAQDTVQSTQVSITHINDQLVQGSNANSLFTVIDAPVSANRSVSRTKQYLMAGGIGAVIAILACAVYIVLLVRRDRAVYFPIDLQKVTTLPVLMQLPHLGSRIVPLLVQGSEYRDAISGESGALDPLY